MNYDIAMKWAEALRSGKYEQGRIYLQKNGRYCCLGVLCEITGVPKSRSVHAQSIWDYDISNSVLSRSAQALTTVNSATGELRNGSSLAHMNDIGTSFNEIADTIEKNWEKL